MTAHHTKDKGDLGVAKVFADLVSKGAVVLFPATEHAPFDLVAYLDGKFRRVQVKYRAAKKGVVKLQLLNTWSDRNGCHKRPLDSDSIDVLAIYCPQTDACYYVDPTNHAGTVTLRLGPARNGQRIGILYASACRELPSGCRDDQLSPPSASSSLPV